MSKNDRFNKFCFGSTEENSIIYSSVGLGIFDHSFMATRVPTMNKVMKKALGLEGKYEMIENIIIAEPYENGDKFAEEISDLEAMGFKVRLLDSSAVAGFHSPGNCMTFAIWIESCSKEALEFVLKMYPEIKYHDLISLVEPGGDNGMLLDHPHFTFNY